MTAATVISLDNVQPRRINWVWAGYIPAGKLTVFDGDPSAGKSTLSLDLAARLSAGLPWPDGSPSSPGNVLLLSAEDSVDDTIVPRLIAAGADRKRIRAWTEVEEVGRDGTSRKVPPSLPRDIPILRRMILKHRVTLVVIDVLMAYLSGKVDANKDQEVRAVLHQLAALADETDCAFILIRHLNKSGGSNAVYRGGGSIGIIGAARAGFIVARDPSESDRRIMAVSKFNVGQEPPARAYRLVNDPAYEQPRVEWEPEPVSYTASMLLTEAKSVEPPRQSRISTWLTQLLASGRLPVGDVFAEAHKAGFSEDQVKRAKDRVGVESIKDGMKGQWYWELREPTTGVMEQDTSRPSPPSRSSTLPLHDALTRRPPGSPRRVRLRIKTE